MPACEEQINGERFVSPRASLRSAFAKSALAAQLISRTRDSWCIVSDADILVDGDVLVADLAGWRVGRMPSADALTIEISPDWICEVLNLTTEGHDRVRKLPLYARWRVGHAWYLDPLARGLEVYRLSGAHWALIDGHEASSVVRAEPFDACDIDLGALWINPDVTA